MKSFKEMSRNPSYPRGTEIKTGKDHQVLNYTTRGGEKRSIKVHKDKAFSALSHYRSMGHKNVHLEKKEDNIKEYGYLHLDKPKPKPRAGKATPGSSKHLPKLKFGTHKNKPKLKKSADGLNYTPKSNSKFGIKTDVKGIELKKKLDALRHKRELDKINNEATYQGKKVTLNKPMAGDVKKSKDKEKHDAAMRKLRDAPKGSPWMKKAGKDAKMLRYVLNRDVK